MDSSTFSDWNYLPNEIKSNVIRNMEQESRLALRLCSRSEKELVDSVPFRKIHSMTLSRIESTWEIEIKRSAYSNVINLIFQSFDEFQSKLTEEIERSDYIEQMKITTWEPVNLLKFGKLAKIGSFHFSGSRSGVSHTLGQIDSSSLKMLSIEKGSKADFKMNQIIHTNLSIHCSNGINNDMLLKLEGSEIFLHDCVGITLEGIDNFIKKRLANLDRNQVSFLLNYSGRILEVLRDVYNNGTQTKQFFLKSPFPNLKLEVEYGYGYVEGKTIRIGKELKSTNHGDFEKIESLEIQRKSLPDKKQVLIIGKKDEGILHYECKSVYRMQRKLTKILKRTGYIKKLTIQDTNSDWKLTSPKKNQVTVGILNINGGSNHLNILNQIEPVHLKELSIFTSAESQEIYDLPQVIHAEKLSIRHNRIRDDQLLKLNAVWLELHDCSVTDSGIDAFIEQHLLTLNRHDLYFEFSDQGEISSRWRSDIQEVPSGNQPPPNHIAEEVVDSPFPEWKLVLRKSINSLTGSRVRKQ